MAQSNGQFVILTGNEILREMNNGHIKIEPFDRDGIRTNSYDWRLGSKMLVSHGPLDAARPPDFQQMQDEGDGFLLLPGYLYLGETLERTESDRYAQLLNGDRRTGGLGIWVHVSAPLGHTGHAIRWTLEICVVKPVRVYPGMVFGRIVFLWVDGPLSNYKQRGAKYSESLGVEVSRLFHEFGRS